MRKPVTKTEAEWLAGTDPSPMLMAVRGLRKYRKLRMFAVACCRLIWDDLPDERSRRAIDVSERYADVVVDSQELERARLAAQDAHLESFRQRGKIGSCLEWASVYVADPAEFHAAKTVSWMTATARQEGGVTAAQFPLQSSLLRDIFGNIFRPATLDSTWSAQNKQIRKLAEAIYANRAFDQMPALADAIEEDGCHNTDILDHCRSAGRHVRGCWVVDLLIGKK